MNALDIEVNSGLWQYLQTRGEIGPVLLLLTDPTKKGYNVTQLCIFPNMFGKIRIECRLYVAV